MTTISADTLRIELISSNPEFKELAEEHHRYEKRLGELSSISHPSDDEIQETVTLKKKKLLLKDRMESIMQSHKRRAATN